jgi:hypothetical protein
MSEVAPESPKRLQRLRRLRRAVSWMILWLVGILGLIVIINPSEAFKGCIHENKNAAQYQELHEGGAGLIAKLTGVYLRSRVIGVCVTKFADENDRVIGALAAIALAVFTLYLWRATRGLWHYAGIQARDMRGLLKAARDNVEAMKQLHAASEAQECGFRRSRPGNPR